MAPFYTDARIFLLSENNFGYTSRNSVLMKIVFEYNLSDRMIFKNIPEGSRAHSYRASRLYFFSSIRERKTELPLHVKRSGSDIFPLEKKSVWKTRKKTLVVESSRRSFILCFISRSFLTKLRYKINTLDVSTGYRYGWISRSIIMTFQQKKTHSFVCVLRKITFTTKSWK